MLLYGVFLLGFALLVGACLLPAVVATVLLRRLQE